ncbi:MAG TPA: GNAT family N-acetyltransferase [Chitinophagaceae bacterium]|nr:GNAT family N-acetyltransferase [Chitinophagaceae bacterium]
MENAIENSTRFGDVTTDYLEQLMVYNHTELFKMNAISSGGEVCVKDGVVWTFEAGKHKGNIAFPVLTKENAGSLLDEIIQYYREKKVADVGCWSRKPLPYRAMGVKLLARGFQFGWKPNWMALDLDKINTGHNVPPGLEIKADNETSTHGMTDLPYSGDRGAVASNSLTAHPDMVQRFIARLDGEIVGQSAVFIPPGGEDACGLYEVGVVPAARKRGIGKAVVTAACLYAKEKGCRYATLNGTGKKMYEQVGFVHIGYGRTWWANNNYITNPPSRAQVLLAEAAGTGNIAMLDEIIKKVDPAILNVPMTNKMTFVELAAYCGKPASAEWLVKHGANYTVLDAWRLGWKLRAEALLAEDAALVNKQYGEGGLTLLHIAAEKNDIGLAELALAARPDITIQDNWHNGIPLGWAYYLERKEIIELITKYTEQQKS